MLSKIRWGIIGCGGIAARRTIPEMKKLSPHAELIAVMDIAPKQAASVAARFDIPHVHATERELLEDRIDAVYIATPPYLHCEQTVRAAEAGKHVLCEKPMTLSLQEADTMRMACSDAGIKFSVGFCMRNNVYNKRARALVQTGHIGQAVFARAQLTSWYPPIPGAWRQNISLSGGGSFIDMGVHCLDLLEWIGGSKINQVCGFQDQLTHKYETHVEDMSTLLVRFANGAHGLVDTYFNVPDHASMNRLELYGTMGSILAEGTIGQEPTGRMLSVTQRQTDYDPQQSRSALPITEQYDLQGAGIYAQMIEEFSNAVLNDVPPTPTIDDARHSVAVVCAAYESVARKQVIQVTD